MVEWGNAISSGFNVSNGIRQGGLISPELYNIYTDDLNRLLVQTKIGCHVSGECVNHVSYADDLVILAPSVKALQRLLDTCSIYANDHDIIFNSLKTVCMVFRPRGLRDLNVRKFSLREFQLEFVEEVT